MFAKKKDRNDPGYDLICRKKDGRPFKVEVKSTRMKYNPARECDIRKQLYFTGDAEIDQFEHGKTKVVRVFLGNRPRRVLMFDISIQKQGKVLKREPRAFLNGDLDYGRVEHLQ